MKVTSLIIVGGGTSAWLAAAYLTKNQPEIKITVIDKEVGNAIGVGEATILTFKPFMEECGFNIEDWLVPLQSGYKSGIMFSNWREDGDDIWHPFYKGNRQITDFFRLWDIWTLNQDYDFKKHVVAFYNSSVFHNSVDVGNINSYAFHIDCGKLVLFLQEKLKDKVNIIKSDVINVVQKDEDNIDYLELKNGDKIYSDLYVDCTGFKNVLRKPKNRIDLKGRLFVDTAVVCPVMYENRSEEFKPYAICDAVDHGWVWKIGVSSRIGTGMVFNRNITDIEEAKEYFVKYWNNRIKKENVRVINWDPFYNGDQWAGNIVSIGLSAGFIEPLESTGIGLITTGITQLNNALRERTYSQGDIDYFNIQMRNLFDDCVDFVSMHYANNTRTTNFWSYVKKEFKPSVKMLHYIEELKDPNLRIPMDGKFNYMFGGSNWSLLLIQLGYEIVPKNINISKEIAAEIIVKNYVEHEKNRHVWSRHHSTEIDRIIEIKKL